MLIAVGQRHRGVIQQSVNKVLRPILEEQNLRCRTEAGAGFVEVTLADSNLGEQELAVGLIAVEAARRSAP